MVKNKCKLTGADRQLIKRIDERQRATRSWFFKGIIGATWIFFTWLLYSATILVLSNLIPEVEPSVPPVIVVFMSIIILVTYSYMLVCFWNCINKYYNIESIWNI